MSARPNLRLLLSLALLLGGAAALLTGAYLCAGVGVALIVAGVLAFAAEWLVP